jgi:hypothetical protein|nr:MAG TPA: tail fiber protein [Caudoviricetes sp.]
MEYGKLKVTVDYGDGFKSEATYHAYHFVNEGTDVSCLMDVNSVDHAAQIHFDVDVVENPQGIFGGADNITYEWVQAPAVTGLYIEHGDNLNDFMEPGVYCREAVASADNVVTNVPECVGTSTFVLEVLPASGGGSIVQRITRTAKSGHAVAQRAFYGGSWGPWVTLEAGQKVLWSGAHYMQATQFAELSETVDAQANGIVLVFSIYTEEEGAQDSAFSSFFIPKKFVELKDGCGMCFNMTSYDGGKRGHKYLYIKNGSIVGHANNNQDVTKGGVLYSNRSFVLRYVLGC